ncbi:MAG: formylglycine-generating enzyme family protein [Planctomycetota bacterium]|jgi:iron(II)-dependent oxidoreductase
MGIRLFSKKRPKANDGAPQASNAAKPKKNRTRKKQKNKTPLGSVEVEFIPAVRNPPEQDQLKRMMQLKRYAHVLQNRQQWANHPHADMYFEQATRQLEQSFALVPAGSVTLARTLTGQPGSEEVDYEVDPFLLCVHQVTNAQFQEFVDADGYDDLDYWPEDIWPHLIEFKDATGKPGPRFWRDGRHNANLADHPVTGVSWYEANAYAIWVGLRLPTEPEWQMACSWHINSTADLLRRYPWGDAMDNQRCNIWSSRVGAPVAVHEYPEGAAPNHVLQLVGNVWEWLGSDFEMYDDEGRQIIAEMPMKGIRGGAFDTYFETQLVSDFRTGQITLARVHNVGFRCAMDLSSAAWLEE